MLFAENPPAGLAGPSTSSPPMSSTAVIERARSGVYTPFEVQRGLGINQMICWFEEADAGWRAVEGLRRPVRFQVHNLLEQPPHPGAFDIVLCRNVLLYLSPEKPGLPSSGGLGHGSGWRPMLGAGQTVIGQTRKLVSDSNARGLYRLVADAGEPEKRSGDAAGQPSGLDRRRGRAMRAWTDRAPFPNFDERQQPVSMIVLHYTACPTPRARSTG